MANRLMLSLSILLTVMSVLDARKLNKKHKIARNSQFECQDGYVKCRSYNSCIPQQWLCDGYSDCGDNSDEPDDCPPLACSQGYTKCPTVNRCKPSLFFCDGEDDCGDNSDEPFDCDSRVCPEGSLRCASGQCIDKDNLCYGARCADGTEFPDVPCPKTSWPELVGEKADSATEVVLSDIPDAEVVVIEQNSEDSTSITDDYQSNRVRLFVDGDGIVFMVPSLG